MKLGIVNVEGGDARFVDLAEYKADDMLIARLGWLPEGQKWVMSKRLPST